jgi:hypothetical protein
MKRKLTLVLVLFLGLLLSPLVTVAQSGDLQVVSRTGDGHWDGDDWYVELYPGEWKSSVVEVKNVSGRTLTVRGYATPCCYDGCTVTICLYSPSASLAAGATRSFTVVAAAKGAAAPGNYTAQLVIQVVIPDAPGPGPAPCPDPDLCPEPDPCPDPDPCPEPDPCPDPIPDLARALTLIPKPSCLCGHGL